MKSNSLAFSSKREKLACTEFLLTHHTPRKSALFFFLKAWVWLQFFTAAVGATEKLWPVSHVPTPGSRCLIPSSITPTPAGCRLPGKILLGLLSPEQSVPPLETKQRNAHSSDHKTTHAITEGD